MRRLERLRRGRHGRRRPLGGGIRRHQDRQGTAAAARSWIVLQSPAIGGSTYQICVSFDGAVDTSASVCASKAGFTGGSTTARPTAVDEWLVGTGAGGIAATQWNGANVILHRFNMALSATGDFIWYNVRSGGVGVAELAVMFVAPVGVNVGDAFPVYTFKNYVTTGAFAANVLANASSSGQCRNYAGVISIAQILAPLQVGANTLPDALTNSQVDIPCWLLVNNGGANWHTRGRLPDMGLIPLSISGLQYSSGNTFREAGLVTYVSMGALFIPSNAAPNMA